MQKFSRQGRLDERTEISIRIVVIELQGTYKYCSELGNIVDIYECSFQGVSCVRSNLREIAEIQ